MSTISEKILAKMNEKYQKALQLEAELNEKETRLSALQRRIIERQASIDDELNQKCLAGVSAEESKKLMTIAEEKKKSIRQECVEQSSEIEREIKRLQNQLDELDEEEVERRRLVTQQAKAKQDEDAEDYWRRKRNIEERQANQQRINENWMSDHRGG